MGEGGESVNAIRLELLGPPEVLRGEDVVTGMGRKPMALLAYLATPKGRLHNRDALATLLWSDRFDEQARQSLRQTLSTLRKSVGEVIVTNDHGAGLDASQVECDVEEFEQLAASSELAALHRASAIYRGEFMEGFPRSSPAFDDWLQSERRRVRDKLLNVLEQIMRGELAANERERALAAARRLVAEEPAHEPAHRTIMQVLAHQGQRAAALRQFETCTAALKKHLDAEPEPDTVALAARIRSAPETAPQAEQPPPPTAAPQLLPRVLRRRPVRRLLMAGSALIVALGAATLYFAFRPQQTAEADGSECSTAAMPALQTPAIAVLPFEAEAESARFADMLSDRIGDAFSAVPGLSVVIGPPRGHADLRQPRRELARALGVSHILDGAVRSEGANIVISIRLIDGASGEVLWSLLRSYDARTLDRLTARDELAIEAVRASQRELTDGDQALHFYLNESPSLAALEHVLAGAEHLRRPTRAAHMRARAEFDAALAIDPRDPPAHVGQAWIHTTNVLFGWSEAPEADLTRAEAHVDAALRSDPDYFYAFSVRGMIALLRGEHDRAVAYGEEALRLSGGGADALALHALTLSYTGDVERSLQLAQRALRLRPYTHPEWYEWILARAARLNGAPQTTLACLPQTALQDSGIRAATVEQALALSALGQPRDAQRLMRSAVNQDGFTAATYCAHPPYATEPLTQQCVAAMRRAGAP